MHDEEKTIPSLLKICRQIARNLSDETASWKVIERNTAYVYVKSSQGITISIGCDGLYWSNPSLQGKRLEVHGVYPHDCFNHPYYTVGALPKIGISADRSASQIAADIRRRLLPSVIEHSDLAREWAAKTLRDHRNKEAILKRLIKAGSGSPFGGFSSDPSYRAGQTWRCDPRWTATVEYHGNVNLELRDVSPAMASRILKMIKAEALSKMHKEEL